MPFITVDRKVKRGKVEELHYPEVKFEIEHEDRKDIKTIIIEGMPQNRLLRMRHAFQSGDYSEYYIQVPWHYMLCRINEKGTILLSAMFFSEEELKSMAQKGVCAAPLPNMDYGRDHGIGCCLWAEGKSFGKTYRKAAVGVHQYWWTSNSNTGVHYYDTGRPKEIQASSWRASMQKWADLTKDGKKIKWISIKSHDAKEEVKTLKDAFDWLSRERDGNYH